jgi:hypothetical protein
MNTVKRLTSSDRLVVSYLESATSPQTLIQIAIATGISVHTLCKVSRRLVKTGAIAKRKAEGTTEYFVPSIPSSAEAV